MRHRLRPAACSLPGLAVRGTGAGRIARALPEETAVALVYDGTTQAVMMATPQDIEDLALGFSLTEGFVEGAHQIEEIEVARHALGLEARMWLAPGRAEALRARRRHMAGPVGCGMCGLDSLEAAARTLPPVPHGPVFAAGEIAAAADALREHQPLHDRTHAVHAAGFLLPGRGIVLAREDVGRHNALDKLVGAMQRAGMAPGAGAFVISSRVSVEMVQKTAMAGVPLLVAVSAPTAHAVRLADGAGMTLAALARGRGFEIYAHPWRIAEGEGGHASGAADVA